MQKPGPDIRCHCTNCAWQFQGSLKDALQINACGGCGASVLVLTTPASPSLNIPSQAGEPLEHFKQKYMSSAPPATQGYSTQRARSTGASIPRPRGATAPRAVASYPNRAPQPRRQYHQHGGNSNTGLYVGLGIGVGVVLVVIIGIVVASTGMPDVPVEQPTVADDEPEREPPSSADVYDGADAVEKQFRADVARAVDIFEAAKLTIASKEDELIASLQTKIQDTENEVRQLGTQWSALNADLKDAQDQLDDKQREQRSVRKEIKELRNGQGPLFAYIGAYDALTTAFIERDELELNLEDKSQTAYELGQLASTAENDLVDLKIAAETADSSKERAAAKLAMNEAEKKVRQRNTEYADAQDDVFDARRALSRKIEEIDDLKTEAAELRDTLDADQAITIKVTDAIKAYQKSLVATGRAMATLKAYRKALDKELQSTDNPYARYARRKAEYFDARKARLEAGSKVSSLERDYLENGGGRAAKDRIRRAKDVESRARDAENAARKRLREAEDEVDAQDDREDDLLDKIEETRELLQTCIKDAEAEQERINETFEYVLKAIGPEEQRRQLEVEQKSKKLKEIDAEVDTLAKARDDVNARANRVKTDSEHLTAFVANEKSVLKHFWSSTVMRDIEAVLKLVHDIQNVEALSYIDGERLREMSGKLAEMLTPTAMREATTYNFRSRHEATLKDWTKALQDAQSAAYRLESAGTTLERELGN